MVELSEQLLAAAIFLSLPLTFLRDANVSVDLLTSRLPTTVQRTLFLIAAVTGSVFLVSVAYYLGQLAFDAYLGRTTTLTARLPLAPFMACAAIGALAAAGAALLSMLHNAETGAGDQG